MCYYRFRLVEEFTFFDEAGLKKLEKVKNVLDKFS